MFHYCFILFAVELFFTAEAQKYTLLAQLAKQSEALAHGMELANRIGNVGSDGLNRKVAFAAYTSSNAGYSGSNVVKFKSIITNVGNAFSTSTGYFTAPYDGVYVFEWSIKVYSGTHNYPAIYVNGAWKMTMQCTSYSSYYETCSKTTPLQLKKGYQVGIRSYSSGLYVAGTYSSFSGWKL